MLDAVERPKLRDVVARRLKTYISQENLKPGDRLPTETQLAARFGVSRPSLREATKSLEFLGIVEACPGRGLTVGRVNMARVSEFLGFHPALHDVPTWELIDSRILIETGVLPQVARNMKRDPLVYARLSEINEGLRSASTLARWIEGDIAFHRALIAGSGLSPLLAIGDVLAVFFQRFRESVEHAEWIQGVESHQRIIDALKAGRIKVAERELRRHIESHRQAVEAES